LVFGSRVAIETTAFMAMESAMRCGNLFGLLLGNTSAKDLGKEWLQTAIMIGGQQFIAAWLESMEQPLLRIPRPKLPSGGSAQATADEAFVKKLAQGAGAESDITYKEAKAIVMNEYGRFIHYDNQEDMAFTEMRVRSKSE